MLVTAGLSASCQTSKIVGQDVKNVVNGQPMDNSGLKTALASDTKDMEANLKILRGKLMQAYAQLRANVQKRWGQNDAKMADRTVYVKYTQGYKSRVVTDFDHGSLTIETVDDKDPQGSLRNAIVAALLTSNDPGSVDLFTDKDVALDPNRKPYLYGLVKDNTGKPIRTRAQAEAFASFLVSQKIQTRPVTAGPEGGETARFVKVAMVRNFEAKGADRYRPIVDKYAAQYHVSPTLVLAIMRTESNFNPFAVSGAPAYGLMQLVPTSGGREAYKRVQGVDQTPSAEYLFDPDHSIELGSAYLGTLSNNEFHAVDNPDSRDYCVIAAYNTGPRNVTRTFSSDRKEAFDTINHMDSAALYDKLRTGLPMEETRVYVVRVSGYRKQFAMLPPAETPTTAPSTAASH
ncbi:MAG TPA: murein transglycosylase domain-containing protein [Steroidobacteraceae bacterium]|nr:murein transglycosylase domain-containing protein [Steroidobacteraceae bacterium]